MNRARAAVVLSISLVLGIPNAAARVPTIEALLNLHELGDYRSGLAVSPDGNSIALFEREMRLDEDDYRYRLVVTPSGTGDARIIAEAGSLILRNSAGRFSGAAADRVPAWSPDGHWLAYLAERGGRVELWRVRRDGGAPEPIAAPEGNVTRFVWLNEHALLFEAATPREELAALTAAQARAGFHADDTFEPYYSLRPHPPVDANRAYLVIDTTTRATRTATQQERARLDSPRPPSIRPDAISFDTSADVSAWIAPRTPGDPASTPALGLFVNDDTALEARRCAYSQCSGRMLDVWIFGQEILFRRMEGHGEGLTALYAWNWTNNVLRQVRGGDEELLGCARTMTGLACLQESPLQPRRLVSIDPASGDAAVLYDPNPDWREMDLTPVERLDVRDVYGNEAFAHLVFPHGYVSGQRYPVVIVQYRSRGFLRGGVGGEYPIHVLAARGYLVLSVDRPEWRGAEAELSPEELERRTELDGSENRMKQSVLEALLAELDRRGLSETDHVGITGLSDGAETVYWAITRSDLFAAAVTSTPPTDPLAWTLGATSFRQSLRDGGTQGPWPDAGEPWASWWAENSTVLHADSIHAPLLMNLPESEALMGFPLATRLSELERPVEVYVYPGAYHVKWRPNQLRAAQHRALDWLDFWLRDVEINAPDEPDRLERWRALRTRAGPSPD